MEGKKNKKEGLIGEIDERKKTWLAIG